MPSRDLNRRLAALAVVVALLAMPAAASHAAQPGDSQEVGTAWSRIWSSVGDLFASWLGLPGANETQRVSGENQLGSLLDPDGVVATQDPTTRATAEPTSGGELGSLLDPDG